MNKQWYKFTENNDWEGETWHFFVKLTEEEAKYLSNLVQDERLEDSYSFSLKVYPEEHIDIMVQESDEGYMPQYNKCSGPFKKSVLLVTPEEADEEFYKGKFWN